MDVGKNNLVLMNDRLEVEAVLGFGFANHVVPEFGTRVIKGREHGLVRWSVKPADDDRLVVHGWAGSGGVVESVEMIITHGERLAPGGLAGPGIETDQSDGFLVAVLAGDEEFVLPDDGGAGAGAGELGGPEEGVFSKLGWEFGR